MLTKPLFKSAYKLAEKTILVIGDIMLDEYHWCKVSRISPEAPVPVCQVTETTHVPGGASNVAHNIAELNCRPILFGVLGQDSSGEKLLKLLKKNKVDTFGVATDENKPTILKSRIIAHHQHVARVDRESTHAISRSLQNEIIKKLEKTIPNADAVLLSDYLKGTLSKNLIQKIITLAHTHNRIVIVDPKGTDYMKYKNATLLTPNFSEFKEIIKKEVSKEKEIEVEAKKLIKKLHLKALLITRSEKGMSLVTPNEKIDIETQAKDVFDITGAGDTVIATLSAALAAQLNFEEAAILANYAASIVVGKVGTSTTTLSELITLLEKESTRP